MKSVIVFFSVTLVLYTGRSQTTYFYRDLDPFELKGVGELDRNSLDHYPYYRVININEHKRVIEFIKFNDSYAELYERLNGYWLNLSERKGRNSHVMIFTYVFNNKILKLEYLNRYPYKKDIEKNVDAISINAKAINKKEYFLSCIKILTEIYEHEYYLDRDEKKVFLNPSPQIINELNDFKYSSKIEREYVVNDSLLVVNVKQINGENITEEKQCYSLKDKHGYIHNPLWALELKYSLIECP